MNANILKVLLSICAIMLVILIILIKVVSIKEEKALLEAQQTELEDAKPSYTRLSAFQAKSMYDEDRANVIFLDIREKKDYNFKHIPSAINVSSVMIKYDIEGVIKSKKTKIIVYGARENDASFKAVDDLINLGYKHVYYLTGGISSWTYATI